MSELLKTAKIEKLVTMGLHVKWVPEEEATIKARPQVQDEDDGGDTENIPEQNPSAPTPARAAGNMSTPSIPVVLGSQLRPCIRGEIPVFPTHQLPPRATPPPPVAPQTETEAQSRQPPSSPPEPELPARQPHKKRPADKEVNKANDAAILADMGKGQRKKTKKKLSIEEAPAAKDKAKARMPRTWLRPLPPR